MPVRIEVLTAVVIWLIIAVVAVIVGIVLVTVQRRINRGRYFERLDRARQRAQELLEPFYQKKATLESIVASCRNYRSKAERQALEDVLFCHTKIQEELALTREVLRKLGWIREWIDILRSRTTEPCGEIGKLLKEIGDHYPGTSQKRGIALWLIPDFTARCIAADKLARVPAPEGLCALVAGSADPHPEVREVCIRQLGNFADPACLPLLLEQLVYVLGSKARISVRNIKSALVRFSLQDLEGFLPALEHPNRRVRFFAVDIIREIADRRAAVSGLLTKNDFSSAIYRLFTERLYQDEFGDVRARSAAIVAHFHDPISYKILEKLLQDKEWFVRMHACRALGSKSFIPIAPVLAERIGDSNWLVREAAVRSLMKMGQLGTEQIVRTFLTTQDKYASEQISEELQRSGVLIELLASITSSEADTVTRVIRRMLALNKSTMLISYLMSPLPSSQRLALLQELSASSAPDCRKALQICAEGDLDPQLRLFALNALRSAETRDQATAAMVKGS